jgi:signal transduction histidine kinase/DNA-binding CsgD family transcriptional regulator
MLLDYARKSCGARLALLFVLDRERENLALLAQSGRRPASSSTAPDSTALKLPLQGLFASALLQPGFLDIPDISHNPLSLPEERSLAWPRSRVLLHALRQGARQGVLVFCFSPAGSRAALSAEARDELLICISLLSAYLGGEEEIQTLRKYTEPSEKRKRQARRAERSRARLDEQEEAAQAEERQSFQSSLQFDEVLSLLIALCELGLTAGEQMDQLALNEQILSLLSSTLRSSAGCLWLYQPDQKMFLLQSSLGQAEPFAEYATDEINRLARTFQQPGIEPAYGLITLPNTTESILVWQTLNYRERLLGALGMVLRQEPVLLLDQRLLLNAACDVVALLLLHYEQYHEEQQRLLKQERQRLAREIHDSVMQDMAHVTQKLDYIQRILEKQPQAALGEIEQARELLNRSLRDLRSGISSLLPVPLEEQAFDEALKALLHEYTLHAPHLKITYDADNLALWPQALQAPIYRFMQEALHNVRKHAAASEVTIRLRRVAGLGVVQVSDNGQGFAPEQVRKLLPDPAGSALHIGLQTMEERIRQAGGSLEIQSAPGAGTTLKARFPLTPFSALLTEREREVLRLMVEGLTNRAISERLSVSLETVKSHVHHIMQKMHVKDRTQAAVVATKQQWL